MLALCAEASLSEWQNFLDQYAVKKSHATFKLNSSLNEIEDVNEKAKMTFGQFKIVFQIQLIFRYLIWIKIGIW